MFVEWDDRAKAGAPARRVLMLAGGGTAGRIVSAWPVRWCALALLSVLFALVWAATSR